MEASISSATMESDVGETKVLKALIEAFSSEFSLREIASAYCKALRDPNRAAEILYDGQKLKNCSNAASAAITTQCKANGTSSSASSLCESVDDKPSCANYWDSKASKTKKLSVSIGSVSGVIGKGHAMPNTPAWGPGSSTWPSLSETLCGSVATNWGADNGLKASKLENPALSVGSVSGVIGKGHAMPNTPAWGPGSSTWPSLSETLCGSVATNWGADNGLKASKLENPALSVGSVSGVIGKGHAMPNTPAWGPVGRPSLSETLGEGVATNWGEDKGMNDLALSVGSVSGKCLICSRPACGPLGTTKPLKLDTKDFRFDELPDDDVASDSAANEDQMHTGQGRIFVGGLSPETNEDTLKDHFKKFGKVVETVIMKDKDTGSLRGFGYVLFSDPSVADKVLLERHVILGRLVGVEKAEPKPRFGHNNPCNQKGFNKKSNGNNGQFRTKKIFVGGLPHRLTEKEFKAYFEKFGRTTEVVIMHAPTKDRPKGFGFITFKSEEAVENVMQQRFHELDGKVVEVERAVEKKTRKRFHELYGHNGGDNMRTDGGRGESLAGGTNSSSKSGYGGNYPEYSPQLSGYASAGGTPVVSPRSPL
ncbi:cytoplasmic polyadenylation element-binding protein 2-like [Papaver somniferum]|nr:cytoplasmic polyadenylation element-binding protein 2-like [Papaver somniferum]